MWELLQIRKLIFVSPANHIIYTLLVCNQNDESLLNVSLAMILIFLKKIGI